MPEGLLGNNPPFAITDGLDDHCSSCRNEGDYHDPTGEWRGYCTCTDGFILKGGENPARVMQALYERAHGKNEQATKTFDRMAAFCDEIVEVPPASTFSFDGIKE